MKSNQLKKNLIYKLSLRSLDLLKKIRLFSEYEEINADVLFLEFHHFIRLQFEYSNVAKFFMLLRMIISRSYKILSVFLLKFQKTNAILDDDSIIFFFDSKLTNYQAASLSVLREIERKPLSKVNKISTFNTQDNQTFILRNFYSKSRSWNIFRAFRESLLTSQKIINAVNPILSQLPKNILLKLSIRLDLIHRLMECKLMTDSWHALNNNNNIKGLVVPMDTGMAEKIAVLIAKKYKVPTFVIQHGMTGKTEDSWTNFGYFPIAADFFYAAGNWHKQNLLKLGCKPNRIIVTGQPRDDNLFRTIKNYSKKADQVSPLSLQKKHVALFASQTSFSSKKEILFLTKFFAKVTEINSDWEIIIKTHPAQNSKYFENSIETQNLKSVSIYKGSKSIHELILSSEAVLTAFSTVGMEALLAKRPLIQLAIHPRITEVPYSEMGLAQLAHDPKTLSECLLNLNNHEVVSKEKMEEIFYLFDGKSSLRVAEHILSIVR